MSDKTVESNANNKQQGYHLPQRVYWVLTGVTSVATLISGFLSLEAHDEANYLRERNKPILDNPKRFDKFTAISAVLFGAEVLGGMLWQKSAEKKAKSFAESIEQEKSAPAPSPSTPSR